MILRAVYAAEQPVGEQTLAVKVKLMNEVVAGEKPRHGMKFILWRGVHIGLTQEASHRRLTLAYMR